ncbi:sucrose-phosphate phosphatase [Leptolyngbya sp. GGD]|uniref:sucrose-phosphate phosphatase n=1 Tax=Leptolyngbya sp. GGD TaxID=2997907 RepID=UPI00227BCFD8|nr:sucrose-phosphate phosphatase [Leptolyngbya sp. GGD]MCY6492430.1 sucrose-phosphate phosphatase [Leptolyngbya sp. GGD]
MSPFLFVTDLDHTLVGDDFAHEALNEWLLEARSHGSKIVYSTGRSLALYRELAAEAPLFEPDLLIAAVGTAIYTDLAGEPDATWSEKLKIGWNVEQVRATTAHFADLVLQPDTEQSEFKVSFFLTEEASIELLPQLDTLLTQQGLDVQLIYSSGRDLDILPRHANKGSALTFVRQTLNFAPEATIVCGDSGNDIALFAVGEERGIIVGNAQAELLAWHRDHPIPHHYLAQSHCAAGILEGLKYFGFQ